MGNRKPQPGTRLVVAGESGIGLLYNDVYRLRDEGEPRVSEQRSGQQVSLAQDLKSVADPQERSPLRCVLLHRLHDGAEARDGTRSQIIAVAEAAGQDHNIRPSEVGVAMPDEVGFGSVPLSC